MNFFKTLIIFVAALFLGTTILTTAKEVQEVDYPSSKSGSDKKEQFNYNETYGPSPIFTIGGGLSQSPGGWSLTTRLDLPYKDDLYIGPVVQYVEGDNQTLIGVTGNIKKILPSTNPKVVPSIEAGIGVLVDDREKDNDDNDSSMLTVVGAGFDYVLSEKVSIGAHTYINNSFDFDHKEFFFTALVGLNIRLY